MIIVAMAIVAVLVGSFAGLGIYGAQLPVRRVRYR
jgi:hypothetical protein